MYLGNVGRHHILRCLLGLYLNFIDSALLTKVDHRLGPRGAGADCGYLRQPVDRGTNP